jgi:methyl-accepting chemotaxis protein
VVRVAENIARGDLSDRVDVTSQDETGKLQAAMKQMSARLANVIDEVRGGAEAVSAAAAQLAQSSQTLSQGTSEQAAALEETTSSLAQMSASIAQNATSSREMEQMATGGAVQAAETAQSAEKLVAAMKIISEKINIIDEIAYQTNLLSQHAPESTARASPWSRRRCASSRTAAVRRPRRSRKLPLPVSRRQKKPAKCSRSSCRRSRRAPRW